MVKRYRDRAQHSFRGKIVQAQELVQARYAAEIRLASELSDIVNRSLKELSEKTGLVIGCVTINTVEVTDMGSYEREWIVSSVDIETSLPPKIASF
jgi:hypothetical protein